MSFRKAIKDFNRLQKNKPSSGNLRGALPTRRPLSLVEKKTFSTPDNIVTHRPFFKLRGSFGG